MGVISYALTRTRSAARFAGGLHRGSRDRRCRRCLAPYVAKVDAAGVSTLEERGFDVAEGGFDGSKSGPQAIEFAATEKQVVALEKVGIEAEPLAIDAPVAKTAALGDSPNPYSDVFRSYSEPGGIKDEMRPPRAANPDVESSS